MANVVQIRIPSGSFTVNPTLINGQTVISVVVQEVTVNVEPVVIYSNDLRAGEV